VNVNEKLARPLRIELRPYRCNEGLLRRAARFVRLVDRRRYDAGSDDGVVIGIGAPLAAKELIIVQRLAIGNEEDRSGARDALGASGSAEVERKP
jgi:hypothetical protein